MSSSVFCIIDILKLISLNKSFTQIYFTLTKILLNMTALYYFFNILIGKKQLNILQKKTDCHVLWDTLYIKFKPSLKFEFQTFENIFFLMLGNMFDKVVEKVIYLLIFFLVINHCRDIFIFTQKDYICVLMLFDRLVDIKMIYTTTTTVFC